jgi:hypothetical protein
MQKNNDNRYLSMTKRQKVMTTVTYLGEKRQKNDDIIDFILEIDDLEIEIVKKEQLLNHVVRRRACSNILVGVSRELWRLSSNCDTHWRTC